MATKPYDWNTTPNYWAGATILLCLVAYGTRMLTPNIFIVIIALMAAARGFKELKVKAG